ncbi:Lrp/AsnC family transcriptional regulator [Polaromonas sp.]|uniref:siroheme decarboxylase subunit beta n=1 Tax=Polaromonas sp. TaxID=1869339 RepID=UPI0013BE7773|nr:Lrp/AsnC family transcriptional regulator [Polaromonas sp.]NDP64151.1 Lrp/AsnC family transcriptional regulator [Polaromonas sp.]
MGTLPFRLLNDWQRDFPLVATPFALLADACGCSEGDVLDGYAALQSEGAISRIGGVWGAGAGGAALLCAFAVAPAQLEAVAALVSAHPGVNHNYERENHHNLWFVITGCNITAVRAGIDQLEAQTGLPALRLPMRRAYRIDLGFDLRKELAHGGTVQCAAVPVAKADAALAGLVEGGLPLLPRPFEAWAQALGQPLEEVLATLQHWLQGGTLRRFGVVVRHHEAGFLHNAMTVFDVPDAQVDGYGAALAAQHGITLAYRRERAPGWRYNLYCMVHGRNRDAVQAALATAIAGSGLQDHPHTVLFSRRRFKQAGARYFRQLPAGAEHAPA